MARILAVALNPAIDIACETDRVQPMLKVRTHGQSHHPGGGGTNVARVIATLGGEPELAYLSGGATGALFDELLKGYALQSRRFAMSDPVRIAFMVHETGTGFEYRFVPDGPEVSSGELDPLLKFVNAFDGEYIVASGSLPRGVPADVYARMADAAGARNIRFVLDTSGDALQVTLAKSKVFLVKPSLRELEIHEGHKLDDDGVREAASRLVERGAAEHVAVSMGREGALLVNRDGFVRLPSLHVSTSSAVGAGDSFVGAMTWRLAQGKPVEEAFRFGIAAGAAAAMTPGTQLCRRDDVFLLFERIVAIG